MEEDKLNELLEDALDDLLLEDEESDGPTELPAPKVAESLKKVKQVVTGGGDVKKSSLESGFPDEEEMARFFEGMTAKLQSELPEIDPDEARAKINESVPQIFDLMQNLLSKELLYPALKDLSPKFEDWLKEKSATLSKADKKRFKKQKAIIDEIIYLFEDESIDNQERFEKNLDLMETMQTLGSPPEELTVPEGVGRCSIM